jgi:MFS superfamily sulfate permease-like transporter
MWRISRQDTIVAFLTGLITFLTTSQIGIVVGIVLSFINTILRLSKPHWAILGEVKEGGLSNEQDVVMERLNIGNQPPPSIPLQASSEDLLSEAQRVESSSGGVDRANPTMPPVRVYRDLTRYVDAKEHQSIIIFRFDCSIYFLVYPSFNLSER